MALPQKVLLAIAVVTICGSSVLALPAHVVALKGRPVVAPVPEPLPLPCRKQHWTNADRVCLTWTAPRDKTLIEQPSHPTAIEAAVDGKQIWINCGGDANLDLRRDYAKAIHYRRGSSSNSSLNSMGCSANAVTASGNTLRTQLKLLADS